MKERRPVGVYGGTFNPVHLGHLRAAEEVVEALDLARMLFVPSADPPHKSERDGDVIAPAEQRLEWTRRAVDGNPRFAVDPLELERGGTSYTVETLSTLTAREDCDLVFTIGRDAFAEIGSWREPETLFTLAHFCVTTRPQSGRARAPQAKDTLRELLPRSVRADVELAPDGLTGRHRRAGTWIRLLEITALDVSASDVRARIRAGRSIRYLVPDAIREAVLASGCYGAGS